MSKRYDDLRGYIDLIESKGLLHRIEGANWDLEIGALTETVAFSDNPKALLFDPIKDYPKGYRVASNLFATKTLQGLALGLPEEASGVELVKEWKKKTDELELIEPKEVSDGPIRENVLEGDEVDIFKFPIPRWHERDGGRYFGTGDTVITRDLESDWINIAVYRSQAQDQQTLGIWTIPTHHGSMHMRKYWKRGEDAPVVITGGQSPYVYAGACLAAPPKYSELEFAGGLKEEPVEVIIDEEIGLPVPAKAEIAALGYVSPPEEEIREEGPFGECAGYYARPTKGLPVINIEKIWYRDDPILLGCPPMHASASYHALGAELTTSARIWDALENEVPNVRGVYSLYQQCQKGSDVMVVSIEQEYAGHAKQAGVEALGSGSGVEGNRMVIVVDEDIDPADMDEVLFALTTRCDLAEDADIIRNLPSSALDARISPERKDVGDVTTSSMLINACKPFSWKEEFPPRNIISDEMRTKVMQKWDVGKWT